MVVLTTKVCAMRLSFACHFDNPNVLDFCADREFISFFVFRDAAETCNHCARINTERTCERFFILLSP